MIGAGLAGQVGLADEVYTNEVQQISGTASIPFTLTYDGATTAVIAVNAAAAVVQAALEALPNIGVGGVVCAGGALPTAVTVTFSGAQVAGRNVPALAVGNGATGLTLSTTTPGTGFGDYVVPTVFPEFVNIKPSLDMDRLVSASLRQGNMLQRTDRKVPNKKGAKVSGTLEVPTKGFTKWLKGIMGAAPTITTPTNGVLARRHRFIFGDTRNVSQVIQTGVPTVNGDASNVKAFTSLGCKCTGASFKCDVDGYLTVDLDYDARDETDGQTLAAASFAAGAEPFHYLEAAITLAGANRYVSKFQLDIKTNMADARRFLASGALKKQQIINALREVKGQVTVEFESMADYQYWKSTTMAGALAPITVTFTGPLIETVASPGPYYYQLVFTMPACDIMGSTPQVAGADLVMVDIPFEVDWDGTNEGLTVDLFTTETTS